MMRRKQPLRSPRRRSFHASSEKGVLGPNQLFVNGVVLLTTGEKVRLNYATRTFLLFDDPNTSLCSRAVAVGVILLIMLSCLGFFLGTISTYQHQPPSCSQPVCLPSAAGTGACTHTICEPEPLPALETSEAFTIACFTFDLVARVLTVHAVPHILLDPDGCSVGTYDKKQHPLRKTLKYVMWPFNLIDVLAILPYYIALATGGVRLGFLRVLRLARVLRVFKLGRYSDSSFVLYNTMTTSLPALGLLGFFMALAMVLFGSLIYVFEQGNFRVTEAHPQGAYYRPSFDGTATQISPFASIPLSFYWVAITITTVGYGDFVPTTACGRLTASLAACFGILCIALPVTIIGSSFNEEYNAFFASSAGEEQEGGSDQKTKAVSEGERRRRVGCGVSPRLKQAETNSEDELPHSAQPQRDMDRSLGSSTGSPSSVTRSPKRVTWLAQEGATRADWSGEATYVPAVLCAGDGGLREERSRGDDALAVATLQPERAMKLRERILRLQSCVEDVKADILSMLEAPGDEQAVQRCM